MKRNAKIRIKKGGGNIFADLGFANPEREELKARLAWGQAIVIKYFSQRKRDIRNRR